MCDERDPRGVEVQPGRDLSVGHNEDVSDPGREPLDRTQREPQLLVVFEPTRRDVVVVTILKQRVIVATLTTKTTRYVTSVTAIKGVITATTMKQYMNTL